MLKTQPKQALRVLLKTVEMVNTSTFRTGIYQHDFSHTFSCFSLPFSKCGHTQVTERSRRPVTWMKCWHFMFLQTNSNVLFITPAFIQCVPNHVHTTCLWDDFHDGRWTGRSLASTASWDGGQARDQCSLTYVGVQELDFFVETKHDFSLISPSSFCTSTICTPVSQHATQKHICEYPCKNIFWSLGYWRQPSERLGFHESRHVISPPSLPLLCEAWWSRNIG